MKRQKKNPKHILTFSVILLLFFFSNQTLLLFSDTLIQRKHLRKLTRNITKWYCLWLAQNRRTVQQEIKTNKTASVVSVMWGGCAEPKRYWLYSHLSRCLFCLLPSGKRQGSFVVKPQALSSASSSLSCEMTKFILHSHPNTCIFIYLFIFPKCDYFLNVLIYSLTSFEFLHVA